MENLRDWNVIVRGRIEHVTDLDSLSELLHTALVEGRRNLRSETLVIMYKYH